jgi:benzylsuccinate CoA-transferase BbsF subunit
MVPSNNKRTVFQGLKVADFCWVGVGPIVGRVLADFGATVIRVESETRPDPLRTMPPFKDNKPGLNRSVFYTGPNCNKRSIALNLADPRAREIAKKLIAWADVMGESFGPGVMERWGFSYEEVIKINPNIVYFSTSMQGSTGPHKEFRGFGLHMAALAGMYEILGWPDLDPVGPYGAFADFVAWLWLRAVVLAAIDYKRRTGKGQYIDLSQLETCLHFLGPLLLDYFVNNRQAERLGNADPYYCPHGVFPCMGEENWIAIAIQNEGEWETFCEILGRPDWSRDPKFASFIGRKANETELNSYIAEWTKRFDAFFLMGLLQSRGIAAGVVLRPSQLDRDPQLETRGWRVVLDHPEIGPHSYRTTGSNFSKMSPCFWRAAPLLGQDTEWVLKEVLSYSDEEVEELRRIGALK